jgi:RimJ/RimL family protein N-acetyltransferase
MIQPLTGAPVAVGPSAYLSAPQVRELHAGHRNMVLKHFLSLSPEDRHWRFGSTTSDAVITRYVQDLNFERDALFGIFNEALDLIGIAHLAYLPATDGKHRAAEFGVSVLPGERYRGLGAALLKRAAIHARNTQLNTLFVHCLANNKAMMHLAQKLGMQVEFSYGDADAYLTLPPANVQSILSEATQEHIADLDYALKANLKQSNELWHWLYGIPNRT